MSCRMPITENALVASLNSFKKSCNASAFAHSYSLGAWWYCSTANLFKAYVAFQQCGTSRTSPDLLLKPSDLTMELKICMRDGDEVTTLIISRTLPIALGITFRPTWTIILRTWLVHLMCKCSPLKNIRSPKASHMSFMALLLILALSKVMVNS